MLSVGSGGAKCGWSLWFVSPDYTVPFQGQDVDFQQLVDRVPNIPYTRLNDNVMSLIHTGAMYPLRYVYAGLIGIFAFWALFRGPETQFRRQLSLDGLIKTQAKNFPVISPFCEL